MRYSPTAIICTEAQPIIASSAITACIPVVDRLDKDPPELIRTGDYVKVDATARLVEIVANKLRNVISTGFSTNP